jgi:hypothetical protein
MQRREALWKTINIQQKFFLGPSEYLLMLIKIIIMGDGSKVKLKVREVQGMLCFLECCAE